MTTDIDNALDKALDALNDSHVPTQASENMAVAKLVEAAKSVGMPDEKIKGLLATHMQSQIDPALMQPMINIKPQPSVPFEDDHPLKQPHTIVLMGLVARQNIAAVLNATPAQAQQLSEKLTKVEICRGEEGTPFHYDFEIKFWFAVSGGHYVVTRSMTPQEGSVWAYEDMFNDILSFSMEEVMRIMAMVIHE